MCPQSPYYNNKKQKVAEYKVLPIIRVQRHALPATSIVLILFPTETECDYAWNILPLNPREVKYGQGESGKVKQNNQ